MGNSKSQHHSKSSSKIGNDLIEKPNAEGKHHEQTKELNKEDILWSLPEEVVNLICTMCSPYDVYSVFPSVSHTWFTKSTNESLWKLFVQNLSYWFQYEPIPISFREFFKISHQLMESKNIIMKNEYEKGTSHFISNLRDKFHLPLEFKVFLF
jgi:hypothetical protein